jgi:hypothetical protein
MEDSLLYSKSYVINYTKEGINYTLITSLTRLNNELYADLFAVAATPASPGVSKSGDEIFSGPDYLNSHTLAKLTISDQAIELKMLDGDKIKNLLRQGQAAVRYEWDELFTTMMVTSSSEQMQELLAKYGKDQRLYSRENTITLKKI